MTEQPPPAGLMSLESAQQLVADAVTAIYDGDTDRFIAALTTGYEPTVSNAGLLLAVIPTVAAVYLRSALPEGATQGFAVPMTEDDAPAHAWWSSRISAAAMNDDAAGLDALVRALLDDVLVDDAAATLCGSVLTDLTRLLVTSVRAYIATHGTTESPAALS